MAKRSLFGRVASASGSALISSARLLFKGANIVARGVWTASKTVVSKAMEKNTQPKAQANYLSFQVLEKLAGDFEKFEDKVILSKSSVGIILGARGSGKSVLGMRLLENARAKGRRVQALGFSTSSLPSWIECIESIEKVKNNSFLLVDEGGIVFSSRSSMNDANKLLSQLLFISRHKDLSVLFISQNSANLDINAIRQTDYLLLKKSSLLQLDFERRKIKEIYEESKSGFEKYFETPGVAFVYSDEFRGFVANDLPSFWSEKASKSFSGFTPVSNASAKK